MNETMEVRIRKLLNEALAKRLLTEYFTEKGITKDKFERNIYPPTIGDLPERIPQFMGKIEIIPSIGDIDPYSGKVKVEWNIFVLGNQRMSLGNSTHKSTSEIAQAIVSENPTGISEKTASPKRIIEFIMRVLAKSDAGTLDPRPESTTNGVMDTMQSKGKLGPGASARFYAGSQGFERNKPVL